MWIAKNITKRNQAKSNCINAAISSANNSEITAVGRDGVSHLTIAAPSVISFSPKIDENAVVLKTESGDVCVGTIMDRVNPNDCPLPGELFLSNKNGTATIKLMADGKIEICGDVTINGKSV